MLPVHQVTAAGVSPMHVAPLRAERIVLVKKMVPALVKDSAVGIVIPICRGAEVIRGPGRVRIRAGDSRSDRVHSLEDCRIPIALCKCSRQRWGGCRADSPEPAARRLQSVHSSYESTAASVRALQPLTFCR